VTTPGKRPKRVLRYAPTKATQASQRRWLALAYDHPKLQGLRQLVREAWQEWTAARIALALAAKQLLDEEERMRRPKAVKQK
jgi:hypothetical protein